MLGLSFGHLLIAFFIFLLLNPRRLPVLGSFLGKAARNFKESYHGIIEPSFKKLGYTKDEHDEHRK